MVHTSQSSVGAFSTPFLVRFLAVRTFGGGWGLFVTLASVLFPLARFTQLPGPWWPFSDNFFLLLGTAAPAAGLSPAPLLRCCLLPESWIDSNQIITLHGTRAQKLQAKTPTSKSGLKRATCGRCLFSDLTPQKKGYFSFFDVSYLGFLHCVDQCDIIFAVVQLSSPSTNLKIISIGYNKQSDEWLN